MGKNRINNLRKITVNDISYNWIVTNHNCDGDGGCKFKIWRDKKLLYSELIHNKVITPDIVKHIIINIEN